MTALLAGLDVVWHMDASRSVSVSFARLDQSERWEVAARFVVLWWRAPRNWAR